MRPGKILRVHISEADRYQGKPLHEVLVYKCRELGMAGATVLRGHEGYGESAMLHRPGPLAHDHPLILIVVDAPEAIDRLAAALEPMLDTGLLATSWVESKRVVRTSVEGAPG